MKNFKIYGVYCESGDCEFGLDIQESITFEDLQHKLTKIDGAFVGDGMGGSITICPHCKEDSLALEM